MVAELFAVSQALEKFAIVPGAVHPWVKPLSKGSFLLTDLDGTGTVRALRLGQPAEAPHIPKVQKDNQNGFPTFKLVYPLFDLDVDAALRTQLKDKGLTAARRSQLLRSGVGIAPRAEVDKNRKRLSQMAKFACELRPLLTGQLDECPAAGRLMDIIKIIDAAVFEDTLIEALLWAIERGEDSKTVQAVLIGEINKRGQVDGGKIPVVLDVYREPGDEIPRLARDQTGRFYSAALLGQQSGKVDGVCALTGYEAELSATSPSPRLPGLADTILFSANPDLLCVTRYGLIGTSAFPIGKSTAQRLNDTALWMTGADRERKTWSQVPRGEGSGRDLVLAYVDLDPALDAPMAELLSSVDATQAEGIFEAKAESVQDALADFRGKLKTGGMLRVLVLRRISKGQVQVELSRMYDVGRLPGCLKDWKAAASNVPMISMARPVAKGQPPEPIPFRIPYPGEVVEATKWLWIRGGDEKQTVAGLPLGRVYDLFLGEPLEAREAASLLIGQLVRNTSALLLLTGDQLARYGPSVQDVPVPARLQAMTAATVLGLGLYKLGRKKETFMSETAFLLGRLLSLSDVLHAKYCEVVRGGQLPPQLLGNQHYAMAVDRPDRALGLLGQRLRIYRAWAETANTTEENGIHVGIARWALKQMGSVTSGLHGKVPQRGLNDSEKAEMLLGYLAREKKEEKENNE